MGGFKVLLISPSNTIIYGRFKNCMPPLGLGYLAAVLEKNNFEVQILDCALEGYSDERWSGERLTFGLSPEEVYFRIRDFAPDLVGISCLFSVAINNVLATAKAVRRFDKNIPIVLGGHHPSALPEEVLKDENIDYAVIGEGEEAFLELVSQLRSGDKTAIGQIDGIAYRGKDGGILSNPKKKFIDDLDSLPLPAWHLFNMEGYFKISLLHNRVASGRRAVPLITSRGCPFHCIFCATINLWGNRFRARSVKSVLNEISFLKEEYDIDEIQFEDDNLTWDTQRAIGLFDGMIEKRLNIRWCAAQGIRVDTLHDGVCRRMRESGCYEVSIGIESGNQEVLDKIIKKELKLEKVYEAVRLLKKSGIRVNGLYVLGLPGETMENMKETCRLARRLNLNSSVITAASPLPGTELYEICRKKNYLAKGFKFDKGDFSFSTINTEDFSSDEVTRLLAKQMLWLNLILPLLRNPLLFCRRFALFFLKKPHQSLRYANLYLRNMLKRYAAV